MKRVILLWTAVVLLTGLLACGAPAAPKKVNVESPRPEATASQTDDGAPTAVPTSENGLLLLLDCTADLDGDGQTERVYIESDDYEWTYITVYAGDSVLSDKLCYIYAPPVCAIEAIWADAGTRQIVLSGDTGSDDFVTVIYAYENGTLRSLQLDGSPEGITGDGTMRIGGYIDLFGTYGATCSYTIHEDMTAELSSDYEVTTYDGYEQERALTVQKDGLSAKTAAGEIILLPVGTTLVLRSTNLADTARCSASIGEDVYLSISKQADDWQWYVNGVPEGDWFGELMYAG